jgi:hypothetical protein
MSLLRRWVAVALAHRQELVRRAQSYQQLPVVQQRLPTATCRLLVDTVHELQTALRIDLTQSLRRLLSTNVVPRSLHLTHAPGGPPFDSIGAKCELSVRAGDNLSSAEKAVSKSALFVQRAIQLLQADSVQTHVARRGWCARPRTEANGAFLVINCILPGSPRIHVVCTYAATPDAMAAIQQQLAAHGASHHRSHHHGWLLGASTTVIVCVWQRTKTVWSHRRRLFNHHAPGHTSYVSGCRCEPHTARHQPRDTMVNLTTDLSFGWRLAKRCKTV